MVRLLGWFVGAGQFPNRAASVEPNNFLRNSLCANFFITLGGIIGREVLEPAFCVSNGESRAALPIQAMTQWQRRDQG